MADAYFTLTPAIIERFWSNVSRCAHGATCQQCCWLWQGDIAPNGYGKFSIKSRGQSAHRLAYRLAFGTFFPQLFVCHRCDVKHCVNPSHLFLGTAFDNSHDALKKGRLHSPIADIWTYRRDEHLASLPRGEQLPQAKLTAAQVRDIRHASQQGETQESIAIRFHVSRSTVEGIVLRKTWKHVD